jgi:glycosyltransferase involved in cell wall biosynthesis
MFPRVFLHLFRRTPVVVHVYQNLIGNRVSALPLPASAFVASSKRIAKRLESLHLPVFVVPPVVDTEFFQSKDPGSRTKSCLYVGNLSPSRFPDYLLEIFRHIVRADSAVGFRVIAPVNHVNIERARDIRFRCRNLGIEDKVIVFLRNMDDEERLNEYRAAKCLIFAPKDERHEAVEPPLTVLEALACGTPVVATDMYSAREVVITGKNGFLVDAKEYGRLKDVTLDVLQADLDRWRNWSIEASTGAHKSFSLCCAAARLAHVHSALSEN